MAFTRKEILEKFHAKIARKEPIISTGAGAGIVASMAEKAGIDFLICYSTGLFRLAGTTGPQAFMPYGDANGIALSLLPKLIYRAKNTPIMGAIGVGEPFRDLDRLLDQMLELGVSGIMHYPSPDATGAYISGIMEQYGIGTTFEAAHINKLRKRDILSVAFAYTPEQARVRAAAGLDIMCAFVGGTAGGSGPLQKETVSSMQKAADQIQAMYEAAKKENPEIIVMCHGGPISGPADFRECMKLCDVEGFVGGSSIERIPIEEAIEQTVHAYQALKLNHVKEVR